MQKLDGKQVQVVHKSGGDVSKSLIVRKVFDLFSFFDSPGTAVPVALSPKTAHPTTPRADLPAVKRWVGMEERIVHDYKEKKTAQFKSAVPLPKTPEKRSPDLHAPRANPAVIRNWVAMEEKIVQNYREQREAPRKSAVPLPKAPAKQPSPAFETFSTQTTVSLSPRAPKLRAPLRLPERSSFGLGKFFLVLGWLAAGVLVFLYLHGVLSDRIAFQRLQSEKNQLEQSYAELQSTFAHQGSEMEGLNSRLRDREADLKSLQENKAEFSRNLEKKYREELMQITVRYENELEFLRSTVRTKDAVVSALKAQIQALEKILDQVRMSAVSGGVAGFFRLPSSTAGVSARQGKILSVNGRQGFFVINLGAEQGARSGRGITVSRDGVRLATGQIDRVYPTMSAVIVRDRNGLSAMQEGDTVSFSS